jgi:flagellar export protein FliJ
VKKFSFSLDRVREWREKQLTVEEARLQQLFGERATLELRRQALDHEAEETSRAIAYAASVVAADLRALDAFRRYAIQERARIRTALDDCARRIAEQQKLVMEARRRVELLDKLCEKRWTAWNTDLAREIEAQAGEAYLAKWSQR